MWRSGGVTGRIAVKGAATGLQPGTQPLPGAVKPHAHGRNGDAKNGGDLGGVEVLPGRQTQQLLVGVGQPSHCLEQRVAVAGG